MKGDQMGTDPTNPSPRELPLSNQTRFSCAEGEPDRGGPPHARSRPYDDLDPAEICGVTGDRVHQRQERDPSGSGLRRKEAQLRRTAFLGQRVFRLDRRTGRGGDPVVHPETGAGGQTPRSAQSVALISHLQVAKPLSRRVSDPSAASSGTSPKAPGFAGGYLLRRVRGVQKRYAGSLGLSRRRMFHPVLKVGIYP